MDRTPGRWYSEGETIMMITTQVPSLFVWCLLGYSWLMQRQRHSWHDEDTISMSSLMLFKEYRREKPSSSPLMHLNGEDGHDDVDCTYDYGPFPMKESSPENGITGIICRVYSSLQDCPSSGEKEKEWWWRHLSCMIDFHADFPCMLF